ncbi:class I SAM-dependent DNA methyltransferase [Fusobacterium polymorphum]|uniref:class I SAM-dependent DNA methyltransferase n=1 Tax=Fusobacterium nucleatum subsp. polymorphum TaxID=76857 RepID=UPI00164D39C8|nr:DNA methyltransferase [Fusobacterium polymorphum]
MLIELEEKIIELIENLEKDKFIFNFLSLYDFPKATITKLEKGVNNVSKNKNEIHLKAKLFFRKVEDDILKNYTEIENDLAEIKTKPRYIIVTDFKKLLAKDTKTQESLDIDFIELPKYYSFFLAWNNIEKIDYEKENPLDIKAAERFSKIYDELIKNNIDIDNKSLNLFLIRVIFCLFAEDTEMFEKASFTNDLKTLTSTDGSDFNDVIALIFEKLSKLDMNVKYEYLKKYPYVNGNLFSEEHKKIHFNSKLRKLIIEAGELLNWGKVNPDILGSMLQAVANSETRSTLGMHYTSVPNIMKVIKPLFLDELYSEFFNIKDSDLKDNTKLEKLEKLLDRIGNMKFFDPACGSGNFLIIAYKELRRLEIEIYELIVFIKQKTFIYEPSIKLSQFYGIEIDDFAHDVAMLSLWIADHQMNIELKERLQNAFRNTLPLQKVGAIRCANSLKIDWEEVCPHTKDEEVFIFGNPPYLGAKLQDKEQKKDLENVLKDINGYKKLDYITSWFYLGAKYIKGTKSELAFVSTNSICQGEQVAYLWKPLLNMIDISFAYTSFKWKNNAKHNAGVTVIIVGIKDKNKEKIKNIYIEDKEEEFSKKEVKNINPYLADGENIIIENSNTNINKDFPKMSFGNMPRDGGYLILSQQEYQEQEDLKEIIKKYAGSQEFINGDRRYVLWLDDESLEKFKNNSFLKDRLNKVRDNRLQSPAVSTQEYAKYPHLFVQRGEYDEAYRVFRTKNKNSKDKKEMITIIVPRVVSENRLYVPMGFVYEDTIIADSAMAIYDAPIWLLAILQSKMHLVWLQNIGGRLKTDYRYSTSLVYNTFPVPKLSAKIKEKLEDAIINIIDFRDENGGTLAELYGSPLAEKNPKPMNEELLNLHKYLDKVVDSIYSEREFKDDEERLALLLKMYKEKMEE